MFIDSKVDITARTIEALWNKAIVLAYKSCFDASFKIEHGVQHPQQGLYFAQLVKILRRQLPHRQGDLNC